MIIYMRCSSVFLCMKFVRVRVICRGATVIALAQSLTFANLDGIKLRLSAAASRASSDNWLDHRRRAGCSAPVTRASMLFHNLLVLGNAESNAAKWIVVSVFCYNGTIV